MLQPRSIGRLADTPPMSPDGIGLVVLILLRQAFGGEGSEPGTGVGFKKMIERQLPAVRGFSTSSFHPREARP